jgi:hypothetical protein
LMLLENSFSGMNLQATFGFGYYARVRTGTDGSTSIVTPRLLMDSGSDYPLETYLVLAAWMWCGFQLILGEERMDQSQVANVGSV